MIPEVPCMSFVRLVGLVVEVFIVADIYSVFLF